MKQVLIHSRQVYTFNSLHNQFPEFLLERLILDEEVKLSLCKYLVAPGNCDFSQKLFLLDPGNSPTKNEHNEHII